MVGCCAGNENCGYGSQRTKRTPVYVDADCGITHTCAGFSTGGSDVSNGPPETTYENRDAATETTYVAIQSREVGTGTDQPVTIQSRGVGTSTDRPILSDGPTIPMTVASTPLINVSTETEMTSAQYVDNYHHARDHARTVAKEAEQTAEAAKRYWQLQYKDASAEAVKQSDRAVMAMKAAQAQSVIATRLAQSDLRYANEEIVIMKRQLHKAAADAEGVQFAHMDEKLNLEMDWAAAMGAAVNNEKQTTDRQKKAVQAVQTLRRKDSVLSTRRESALRTRMADRALADKARADKALDLAASYQKEVWDIDVSRRKLGKAKNPGNRVPPMKPPSRRWTVGGVRL